MEEEVSIPFPPSQSLSFSVFVVAVKSCLFIEDRRRDIEI